MIFAISSAVLMPFLSSSAAPLCGMLSSWVLSSLGDAPGAPCSVPCMQDTALLGPPAASLGLAHWQHLVLQGRHVTVSREGDECRRAAIRMLRMRAPSSALYNKETRMWHTGIEGCRGKGLVKNQPGAICLFTQPHRRGRAHIPLKST